MIELRELLPSVDVKNVVSAARGQTAFYAIDSTVYRKDDSINEWARPGFKVTNIEINKTESLVALSGENDVSVYSYEGKFKYTESFSKGIHKTLWHPMGVDDACLVVLSSGYVRSIWLDSVGSPATDTLDFSRHAFGAQDSPQFATSMTFGPKNATGGFTLYLSTDEGSIFAVSPFLPAKFQVTNSEYTELMDYAANSYSTHAGEDNESIYSQQLEWVKSMVLEPQLKNGEYVHVLGSRDPAPLYCQGPFKICPFPDELYESEFNDISALTYEDLHFLVQSSSNKLLFLLLDEPTPAHWAFSQGAETDSTLTLVDMVTIDSVSKLQITNNLIWGHSATSTVLYKPSWVRTLQEALDSGSTPDLPKTEVTVLQKSTIYENVVDATAVPVLDFAETANYHYIISGTTLPLLEGPTPTEKTHVYHNPALSDLKTLMNDISIKPASSVAGLPEGNLESLAKLDKISDAYTSEISKLYNCVDLAFDAINLQKIELNNQISTANSLKQDISELDTEKQTTRLKNVLDRQERIKQRFSKFEEKAKEHAGRGQPIGQIERRWFRELKTQEAAVAQLTSRNNTVEDEFKNVNIGASSENCSKDYRVVLYKLQRLGNDLESLKSKLHTST